MSNKQQTIVFNLQANIDQIKSAASEINNVFSKLNLSPSIQKSLNNTFTKLTSEIRDFEVATNRGFNNLKDTTKAEKSVDKIVTLFESLKVQAKDLSGMDLSKFLPEETLKKLKDYKQLLGEVEKLQKRDNSSEIKKVTSETQKAAKHYQDLKDKVEGYANAKKEANKRKDNAENEYQKLQQSIDAAREAQQHLIEEGKKEGKSENVIQRSEAYKQQSQIISDAKEKQKQFNSTIKQSEKDILANEQAIARLSPSLQTAQKAYQDLNSSLEEMKNKSSVSDGEIQNLINKLRELTGLDTTKLPTNLEGISQKIRQMIVEGADTSKIAEYLHQIAERAGEVQGPAQGAGNAVRGIGEQYQQIERVNSEMDQLKSRLTYFFSAMNGVQLFKRAIRSAYESVKELDAAITEMAVVTDYSINDIWGNMPQYTKTATELGATTKDVINSMVLYTQQGLDMAQATQLSTETMKMARIAGLEGAEATDLMTAALRGFNMELNETSAQRVNDVYSNLAANAAANTHEIADAMTRTASIANAAGMEFETTAAFLTQMINFATCTRVA